MVNGVDLFTSCGLGRLSRSVGVCAALVDAPNPPRVACFDTTAPGAGVEGLATWIDDAPLGAPILLASCSRLAWQQDLDRVAAALGAIGTNSTPTNIDDAYAVVGVKGGAAPLAEAMQPCCDRAATPICHTCRTDALDRTATADVACGVAASNGTSTLAAAPYLGAWGSPPHVAAVVEAPSAAPPPPAAAAPADTAEDVLAALQAATATRSMPSALRRRSLLRAAARAAITTRPTPTKHGSGCRWADATRRSPSTSAGRAS